LDKPKLESMLDKTFKAEASFVVIVFQYLVCLSRESVILIMLFVIIVNLVEVSVDCFSYVLDFILYTEDSSARLLSSQADEV
jgi:hypothetical protein